MTDGLTIRQPGIGRRIARWLLVAFYGVAGVAHLVMTDAMVRITPAWVPMPRLVVQLTGLCELLGVVALLTPRLRRLAGWAFAAYAICVYPANVNHAMHDLTLGSGLPLAYHGPRLLLQPAIVWWALWATMIVDWPFGRGASVRRDRT